MIDAVLAGLFWLTMTFATTGYGWAGTYYFMDPTTGVAAAFGAQVIPTKDQEVYELWERLEKEMYSVLGVVDE